MKIGLFAKKFNVSIDTIRYYTNLGFLIPVKKYAYYDYDQTCEDDMTFITQLKSLHFTLNEIGGILKIKRVTLLSDLEDLENFVQLLDTKKEELRREIANRYEAIANIDAIIDTVHQKKEEETETGISISFLPLLRCPVCSGSLQLKNARIHGESIMDADVTCSCGFQAEIASGILYAPNLDNSIQNRAYFYEPKTLGEVSTELIELMTKSGLFIYQRLKSYPLANKVILEPSIDTFVMLPKFLHLLQDDAMYIFCGSKREMVEKLKGKLTFINPKLKVLYIVNTSLHLPIADQSVDYIIDSLSFNDYSLFNPIFPLAKLNRHCKEDSTIIGIYSYYKNGAKSLQKMRELYPEAYPLNSEKAFIETHIKTCQFDLVETVPIGDTTQPGIYIEHHIGDERLFLEGYIAKKQRDF
ncbi:MerR family transcriptional regulator [Brevibacillus fluminis]|uniref:MerR family transcriptional regulator n=1 Tax=Brevibacillus fluminis TaxID=511487 RepID=A0A3M8DQE9_9BACL|nr:MerR family transcriptional regulator [Brevibacillus fluminis]RNB89749.1 MerR family transcriptional regulator [Brevibacillus fluminis]